MNGRQRIALAMAGREADRVPVMCQLAIGHYMLNTDVDPVDIWFTSDGFARALEQLQRRYRFDGILVNLPGRPDSVLDRVVSRQRTPDGQILDFDTGERVEVPNNDNAQLSIGTSGREDRFDFLSHSVDDLDSVDRFAGYVWGTYHIPWLPDKADPGPLTKVPEYFYRSIDKVRELTDGEVAIHGEVFSPFTHYMELVGYQSALINLLLDSTKAHAILDRLTTASITWAVGQARRGVDAVLISSAFAGGPLLSPDLYREFVLPYESRVVEATKREGVRVYTHTCGAIGDRLDMMVATGTEGIDTLDPPPLGSVELAEAKARIGDQVFLKGNMDSVELLGAKTADEVLAYATSRIVDGSTGGGYILSTACSVAPAVEPWKLELLTPLAEEVGAYVRTSDT
jgi:hypothetical protein